MDQDREKGLIWTARPGETIKETKERAQRGKTKRTEEEKPKTQDRDTNVYDSRNSSDTAVRDAETDAKYDALKEANRKAVKEEIYNILDKDLTAANQDTRDLIDQIKKERDQNGDSSLFERVNFEMQRLYREDPVKNKDLIDRLKKARAELHFKATATEQVEGLKKDLNQVQYTDDRLESNRENIRKINKDWHDKLISESTDKSSWDFHGIAEEYLRTAELNMELGFWKVYLEEHPDVSNKNAIEARINNLTEEIKIFELGGIPPDIANRIRAYTIARRGGTSAPPPGYSNREVMPQSSQLIGKRIGAAFATEEGGGSTIEVLARHTGAPHRNEKIKRISSYEHAFPIYDLTDEDDHKKWIEDNFKAFTGKIGDSPAKSWMQHINYYVDYDMGTALQLYREKILFDVKDKPTKERLIAERQVRKIEAMVERTKKELIARLSVYSAFEAMKASDGSYTSFMTLMTMGNERGPNLDNVTGLSEYLLTENAEYWWKALGGTVTKNDKGEFEIKEPKDNNSLTYQKYEVLRKAMGLKVEEWHVKRNKNGKVILDKKTGQPELESSEVVDINITGNKEFVKLAKALSTPGERSDGWIKMKLDEEEGEYEANIELWNNRASTGEWKDVNGNKRTDTPTLDTRDSREVAYKEAFALMWTDGKATKWVHRLKKDVDGKFSKTLKDNNVDPGNFNVVDDWGGDPLTGFIDPTVLPEDIKKTYDQPGDSVIMRMLDKAWRPTDIIKDKKLVDATLVGAGTKKTARLADAMFKIYGSSRAKGLPDFGRDGASALEDAMELLDQVYGGGSYETIYGDKISGKELVGMMMSRILAAKARANAAENSDRTRDKLSRAFSMAGAPPEMKFTPNAEALMFLLGPQMDGKAGFIRHMMGGRTRLEFKGGGMSDWLKLKFGAAEPQFLANTYLKDAVSMLRSGETEEAWRKLGELFNILGLTIQFGALITTTALAMAEVEVAPRKK